MSGFAFSQELTERTVAYYAAHSEYITLETAKEYLQAMSDLYGSFMEFVEVGGGGRAAAALAAPSSPDLISPHSC